MTTFGQLVVGPPGSGKSTYCRAMQQFLGAAGRPTAVINLDPANDSLPYECAVNLTDLISLTDVMDEHGLGPNGGENSKHVCSHVARTFFSAALIYCLEYLEQNMDWLETAIHRLRGHYLLLDCPGQAELYTHHGAFFNILHRLQKLDYRVRCGSNILMRLSYLHNCRSFAPCTLLMFITVGMLPSSCLLSCSL